MVEPRKIKVAIVGGGCGALTAAYWLSLQDERYEITVYQMGWRLGGKGASGRNQEKHNRVEEHGLHVWMGFYENAFRLMRHCYDSLPKDGRKSPFGSVEEAFIADHWIGAADPSRDGYRTWTSHFPATPGLPGEGFDEDTNPFTLRSYLARTCDLLRALLHSGYAKGAERGRSALDPYAEEHRHLPSDASSVTPEMIVDKITSLLRTGVLAGAGALYEAMNVLGVILSGRFSLPDGDYLVLKYADAIAKNVRKQAESLFHGDPEIGPKLELVELVVTVIVGILRDELLSDPDGLDAINDEDCIVWLKRHGASERATGSPIVRALYDMAFANIKLSESDVPGLAAGQALRGAFRMFFTYRGSLFWKLRGGMGDTVFSPLYEVLKQRGVKFHFFHELVDVITERTEDSRRVTELHFRKQAQVTSGAAPNGEYYPLDADGCWPWRPDYDQLEPGTTRDFKSFEAPSPADRRGEERRVLKVRRGEHAESANPEDEFDCVVLGVPVGALKYACPTLLAGDAHWRAMVEKLKTVPTQAMQLWLHEGLENLCPTPTPITVSGFKKPFDTWSDMTHVIGQEDWPENATPRALIYFCGGLPFVWNASDPKAEPPVISISKPIDPNDALDHAVDYLDRDLPRLMPRFGDRERRAFRWSLLEGPNPPAFDAKQPQKTHEHKRELIRSHYFAMNLNPSDRYVLTRPGTMQFRISPLDTGYENMTVAGDWTDCGFNEGCVEAAVMSGLLASHAVSLEPALEDIIGFDHP